MRVNFFVRQSYRLGAESLGRIRVAPQLSYRICLRPKIHERGTLGLRVKGRKLELDENNNGLPVGLLFFGRGQFSHGRGRIVWMDGPDLWRCLSAKVVA